MTNDDRSGESFTYEVSTGESLSEGVVAAVSSDADVAAVPEAESETERALDPLFTAIDPEALDVVFDDHHGGADLPQGRVTFRYHGYEVTVHSDGLISLTRPESSAGAAAD